MTFLKIAALLTLLFVPEVHVTNPTDVNKEGEIWGPILEELALTNHREKRVMRLPSTNNAYVVIDRKDGDVSEQESKISPGKVVNQKPPGREVSETDLYLLGAIEKLAYKVDFMEKRLRKVEEMLYYVMAGNRIDQDPCPNNFTRIGLNCYLFNTNAGRELDWKAATRHCQKYGAFLAEMETTEEHRDLVAHLQSYHDLRGRDFWTGGLNPGLLWIWSNSARPVSAPGIKNDKQGTNIPGEGRCLRLAYDGALRSYAYRGTDCAARYSFVCELPENSATNQISKVGRSRKVFVEEL